MIGNSLYRHALHYKFSVIAVGETLPIFLIMDGTFSHRNHVILNGKVGVVRYVLGGQSRSDCPHVLI